LELLDDNDFDLLVNVREAFVYRLLGIKFIFGVMPELRCEAPHRKGMKPFFSPPLTSFFFPFVYVANP